MNVAVEDWRVLKILKKSFDSGSINSRVDSKKPIIQLLFNI